MSLKKISYDFVGCPNPGYYSENCSMPCPSHCVNSRCHVETGQCFECEDGYQGPMCEQCMHCRLTSSFGIVCLLNVQKYGFCFLRIIFILLKIYHLFYSLYLKRIHCQNYVKGYRESYNTLINFQK